MALGVDHQHVDAREGPARGVGDGLGVVVVAAHGGDAVDLDQGLEEVGDLAEGAGPVVVVEEEGAYCVLLNVFIYDSLKKLKMDI